jgi:uncharacterized membrane protein
MHHGVIEFAALFLTGLLAGEEFVVRYGVRGPLAALDDRAHIEFRQGLIRTLRVLVPAIFGPALAAGVAAAIAAGTGPGVALRWAAVLALLGWALVTLFGTVPINSGALDWRSAAPPADWKALIARWERLDTIRTWAAVLAFALFLAGTI